VLEVSKAQRLLSYTLLSLITSKGLAETSTATIPEELEREDTASNGYLNSDGAWCWREGCSGLCAVFLIAMLCLYPVTDCLKLTKAMQKTSDALQTVADLYDNHVCTLAIAFLRY
jgi:sorting nexin-9/18/33